MTTIDAVFRFAAGLSKQPSGLLYSVRPSVLLAGLMDGHLLLLVDFLLHPQVGSGQSRHAFDFSLAHPVNPEVWVVLFRVIGDQIGNVQNSRMLGVENLFHQVLGGTGLAIELPSGHPALWKTLVVLGEAGDFFSLLEVCQRGHHIHEYFDRLEFGGFLGGGREGFVDRFVGDGMEEFTVRALETTGRNSIVVNDGIHFGSHNGMEGFGCDTEHDWLLKNGGS